MRLDECGENGWLARLEDLLGAGRDRVGDDAACVRVGAGEQVLTSDAVIAGRHFDASATPGDVGRKAVGRLLSDLAAMGATPDSALINLAAPGDTEVAWLEACYRAMRSRAEEFGLTLRGGDTSGSAVLQLHLFATGYVAEGKALTRSGAQEGDGVWVTGRLGGSRGGHHLTFTPRVREGLWLRTSGHARAMMDITDGLALDLSRLCRASGTGVLIEGARIPVSAAAEEGGDAVTAALTDGEDYELLFACAAAGEDALAGEWPSAFPGVRLTRIGEIVSGARGCRVVLEAGTAPLADFGGYDHFAVDLSP